MLAERERARLAALTNCDEDAVERIIAAAAAECLVVVLPSFHTVDDFAGWDAFAWDGQAKAAHLAEAGAHRALCGAPRPHKSAPPGPRMRLCIGCESQVLGLARSPGAIAAYDRGKTPMVLGDSPVPPLRRPRPDASAEARPPRTAARPSTAWIAPPPPPRPAAIAPPGDAARPLTDPIAPIPRTVRASSRQLQARPTPAGR